MLLHRPLISEANHQTPLAHEIIRLSDIEQYRQELSAGVPSHTKARPLSQISLLSSRCFAFTQTASLAAFWHFNRAADACTDKLQALGVSVFSKILVKRSMVERLPRSVKAGYYGAYVVVAVGTGCSVAASVQSAWQVIFSQQNMVAAVDQKVLDPSKVLPNSRPAFVSGRPLQLVFGQATNNITTTFQNTETQEWPNQPTSVQFAGMSRLPNNEFGGTLLYGEAGQAIFASMSSASQPINIDILTDTGWKFSYSLQDKTRVSSLNNDIFTTLQNYSLTIYIYDTEWTNGGQLLSFTLTGFIKY